MKSDEFTSGWEPVHVGFEGEALCFDGVNPWLHTAVWRSVSEESIVVPHPSYRHQRHRARVYEISLP